MCIYSSIGGEFLIEITIIVSGVSVMSRLSFSVRISVRLRLPKQKSSEREERDLVAANMYTTQCKSSIQYLTFQLAFVKCCNVISLLYHHTPHHNRFTAIFPGPPG